MKIDIKKYIPVMIVILLITGVAIYNHFNRAKKSQNIEIIQNEINQEQIKKSDENSKEEITQVTVYVSGQVAEQKVITLPIGSRLNDAIKKCGGMTENADINRVNLALKLQDEGHYIVPAIGEEINIDTSNAIGNPAQGGKVNLNTADATSLMTLDGIGEKTADKIIKYRQTNGKFNSIEDIKNVDGIGDKKFNAIKDDITV